MLSSFVADLKTLGYRECPDAPFHQSPSIDMPPGSVKDLKMNTIYTKPGPSRDRTDFTVLQHRYIYDYSVLLLSFSFEHSVNTETHANLYKKCGAFSDTCDYKHDRARKQARTRHG